MFRLTSENNSDEKSGSFQGADSFGSAPIKEPATSFSEFKNQGSINFIVTAVDWKV